MKEIVSSILEIARGIVAGHLDKTFETPRLRLNYNEYGAEGLMVQELPEKGKRRLRYFSYGAMPWAVQANNGFLVANIFHTVGYPHNGESYDEYKSKVEKYLDGVAAEIGKTRKDMVYLNEGDVHYLEVAPHNTQPIKVKGKDFEFTANWDKFTVYDPKSDFQQSDPYYSGMESSAPASARKFYKILTTNPAIVDHLTYNELGPWFNHQGIKYKSIHSSWH